MKKIKLEGTAKTFFIFWLILAAIHLFLPIQWGDDRVFKEQVAVGYSRFIQYSARPISDTVTYIFTRLPVLWRLLNPVVLTLFAKTLFQMLPVREDNKKSVAIFLCCACVYPCMVVVDAGFVATTVNYLWPGLCGLLTLKFLQDSISRGKVPVWQYFAAIPLTLYATNMQQLGVTMFLLFATAVAVLWHQRKKANLYIFFELLLYLAGALFAYYINVFGEGCRFVLETGRYFPTFGELDLFQKAELGISSTLFNLTMHPHFSYAAFLAFLLLLAISITKTDTGKVQKWVIWIAVAEVVVFGALRYIPGYSLGYETYVMDKAVYTFAILPYVFYVILIGLVLYSLYFYLGKKGFFLSLFLLCLGMISRVIMGFSPTVWASGQRTFFIMFIMLIIIAAMVIDTYKTKKMAYS